MTASSQATAGSHFADAHAARRAVEMSLPLIESAMQDPSVCGSGFLVIVIMDPARSPTSHRFEDAILHEHAIGDRARWDADYAAFARAKAQLAWQHQMDSHALQTMRPHLVRESETLLWGSVCLDGIVVGVSGAHAWWDESFAITVAGALRAIAKERHAEALAARQLFAGPRD